MFASIVVRGVLDLVAFSPKKLVRNPPASASRAGCKNVKSLPIKRRRHLHLYIYFTSWRKSRRCPFRFSKYNRHIKSS